VSVETLALVVRVSRVAGREGERFISPGEQVREGKRVAERLGYGVRVFDADAKQDTPGSTPYEERPGMSAALRAIESGKLAGVIVSALDRLVREDPEGGVTLKAFQQRIRKAGAVLVVCDAPDACIEDPEQEELEGWASVGLKARLMVDATLREEARKRWRRARKSAIERGLHVGTPPPGYRRTVLEQRKDGTPVYGPLEIDEQVAPVVRAAFAARARGASWMRVAEILTEGTGKRWSANHAGKILNYRTYLGEVRSGPFVNTEAHPPLMDEATFERVQRRRELKERAPRGEPSLLTGLIVCGSCGNRLTRNFVGEHAVYRCSNGGACTERATITFAKVEPYVSAAALEYMGVARWHDRLPGEDRTAELEATLRQAEADLAEVEALRGTLRPAALATAIDAAMEAVEEARRSLGEHEPAVGAVIPRELGLTPEGINTWVVLDVPEQRTVLRQLIERVEVGRGRGPVQEKVRIWMRDLKGGPAVDFQDWKAASAPVNDGASA
jgi:DNA invertase Pin-like site-specific DNA recombinase